MVSTHPSLRSGCRLGAGGGGEGRRDVKVEGEGESSLPASSIFVLKLFVGRGSRRENVIDVSERESSPLTSYGEGRKLTRSRLEWDETFHLDLPFLPTPLPHASFLELTAFSSGSGRQRSFFHQLLSLRELRIHPSPRLSSTSPSLPSSSLPPSSRAAHLTSLLSNPSQS